MVILDKEYTKTLMYIANNTSIDIHNVRDLQNSDKQNAMLELDTRT